MPAPKPEAKKPANNKKEKNSKAKKEKLAVVWTYDKLSGNKNIDDFLKAVDEVWNATLAMQQKLEPAYNMREDYVQASDGTVYRAVSFVDAGGKMSIRALLQSNNDFASMEKTVKNKAIDADLYLPTATLAVASLKQDIIKYGKLVKLGGQALSQCRRQAADMVETKQQETDAINALLGQALTVDGIGSTDRTLILPIPGGSGAPEGTSVQQLRYYNMN